MRTSGLGAALTIVVEGAQVEDAALGVLVLDGDGGLDHLKLGHRLLHAAHEEGVGPRIGQVTFSKMLCSTNTSTTEAPARDAAREAQHDEPPRKKAKKRKTGFQAKLCALPEYYDSQVLDHFSIDTPTLLCEPLPGPEPDLSALLEPPAPAPSYAQAVRSPAREPLAATHGNAPPPADTFVEAKKFGGAGKGYVYTTGAHGAGCGQPVASRLAS